MIPMMEILQVTQLKIIKNHKPMTREIELLNEAAFEIKILRRQNELMKARLDMFDAINMMLHTEVARQSQGMSPDVVWAIEKFIEDQPK